MKNTAILLFLLMSSVTYVDRELLYCLDHAIHHQAFIKIGLKELQIADLVEDDFGVAYSTLRYRASLDAN